MGDDEGKAAIGLMTGIVAGVAGFQLVKDGMDKYFTSECTRCDGTGKLTCRKCRGYGFLRGTQEKKINAFGSGMDDLENLYTCPFCTKSAGTQTCWDCKGKPKYWLDRPNYAKLWKWHDPHYNALQRYNYESPREGATVKAKEKRKLFDSGLGGFSMSGSANALPLTEEEQEAARAAQEAAKVGA